MNEYERLNNYLKKADALFPPNQPGGSWSRVQIPHDDFKIVT